MILLGLTRRERYPTNMNPIQNQVTLISGASSGIGRAIASKLAAESYSLGLNSRSLVKLNESYDSFDKESIMLSAGDISNYEYTLSLVNSTVDKFGGINSVVVNAGVGFFGTFMDTPSELTEEIVRTNIMGSINLVKAPIPHLTRNKSSNIIFVSSTAGSRGGANEAVYSASKHAQNGLAGSLDREYRKHGVRVTLIAPGATRTNFAAGVGRDSDGTGQEDFLDPEDVAETVNFALSMPRSVRIQYLSILPMSQQS